MMRAFGLGRPVIVSDAGSSRELPEDVCLKIPQDGHEMQVIGECLKWLLANPAEAAVLEAHAQEWIAAECTWANVAGRYVKFLEESAGQSKTNSAKRTGRRAQRQTSERLGRLGRARGVETSLDTARTSACATLSPGS